MPARRPRRDGLDSAFARARVLALWKPYRVVAKFTADAAHDAPDRPTLADLVAVPGMYGAGRLDADSEGLLLLSDAPAVRDALTHPRHHVAKTYLVQVEGVPDDAALDRLRTGVVLRDGPTRPARVELLATPPELAPRDPPVRFRRTVPDRWLRLTITEGRNRQVRRMTAAVGHPTLRLVRWSVGPGTLAGLEPGRWRELDGDERQVLAAAVRR